MSSGSVPLIGRPADAVLFRLPGGAVSADAFAAAARALAEALPDVIEVPNRCRGRLNFALGFAASVLRGRLSLLASKPARAEGWALTDEGVARILSPLRPLWRGEREGPTAQPWEGEVGATAPPALGSPTAPNPLRPQGRRGLMLPPTFPAALVFTSGSTGDPVGHVKLFGALAARSEDAGAAFGFDPARPASIVAMAPPQHMYGFETSVLLPLHAACSVWCGPCFYPGDVRAALAAVPAPRVLVTTPFQLRALLAAGAELAPLEAINSATAPMHDDMAAEAEARFGCPVLEIFGATEVGSIAHRRTLDGPDWTLYPRVRLRAEGDAALVSGPYAAETALGDLVESDGAGRFRLLGRRTDVVKLGGRRASLAGLSRILTGIEGVVDGAFVVPEDLERRPTARLLAFAVAPERSAADILEALRRRVDPVFLPRRVIRVDALPRNALGKLTEQAVKRLVMDIAGRQATDIRRGRACPGHPRGAVPLADADGHEPGDGLAEYAVAAEVPPGRGLAEPSRAGGRDKPGQDEK